MRRFWFNIFNPLMWFLCKVYTYKMGYYIRRIRNYIYTLWIKNFIGELGVCSSIAYPCTLEGGSLKSLTIGNYCYINSHCIMGCWSNYKNRQFFKPVIHIGDYCSIGEYNQITACNKITIGNGLLTGRFVYIGDNNHGDFSVEELKMPPSERQLTSKGEIVIGNNVWIGDKSTILAGVKIGDGAIIGANSVVTHDIPDGCIAVGVPARIIKRIK